MTFISTSRIEARAAELWHRYQLVPGFDVELLLDDLELGLLWEDVPDDDRQGRVLGQLIPADKLVVLNERHRADLEEKEGRLRRFTVGHEIGHWVLHSDLIRSGALSFFDGKRTWCREGSPDPVERQAERFSAALLMPADVIRSSLPEPPWKGWPHVYRLADRFLVNVTPMKIRLEQLGRMHLDEDNKPVSGRRPAPGQTSLSI